MGLSRQGQNYASNPLLAQIEAAQARAAGQRVGLVRGRHLIDWVPTYRQLLREGQDDEALALLLEIIEAAEQLARVDGAPPTAEYTQQAAAVYRRHADVDGELTVLGRYADACPPGTGDPALLARLELLTDD